MGFLEFLRGKRTTYYPPLWERICLQQLLYWVLFLKLPNSHMVLRFPHGFRLFLVYFACVFQIPTWFYWQYHYFIRMVITNGNYYCCSTCISICTITSKKRTPVLARSGVLVLDTYIRIPQVNLCRSCLATSLTFSVSSTITIYRSLEVLPEMQALRLILVCISSLVMTTFFNN